LAEDLAVCLSLKVSVSSLTISRPLSYKVKRGMAIAIAVVLRAWDELRSCTNSIICGRSARIKISWLASWSFAITFGDTFDHPLRRLPC
jgi:hypothetical protein